MEPSFRWHLQAWSPEWLDAVKSIITDLLQGHNLGSLDYSICEDLTSPPLGRANTPAGTLSWFIYIRGNNLEVHDGSIDDAEIRIVADYATHRELSRLRFHRPRCSEVAAGIRG
ncbi:hypothetical protein ACIRRA_25865 [Nocardia sp. NPDC101769]|uniref:hypothetical protein n=1 Tax=Nocardia sp. NPDC101769 TaxID=3364333 RepID=UPI0037FE1897